MSDDLPATQLEVAQFAASLLKKSCPQTVSLESDLVSEMARSFYKEEKRVSNKRLKESLSFENAIPINIDGSIKKHSDYYREKQNLGWSESKINGYGRNHNQREYLRSISKGFKEFL